jgi:hypothetical protein
LASLSLDHCHARDGKDLKRIEDMEAALETNRKHLVKPQLRFQHSFPMVNPPLPSTSHRGNHSASRIWRGKSLAQLRNANVHLVPGVPFAESCSPDPIFLPLNCAYRLPMNHLDHMRVISDLPKAKGSSSRLAAVADVKTASLICSHQYESTVSWD